MRCDAALSLCLYSVIRDVYFFLLLVSSSIGAAWLQSRESSLEIYRFLNSDKKKPMDALIPRTPNTIVPQLHTLTEMQLLSYNFIR